MDSSPPGSSVHRISQERILEWVAISSSRGSSWPRDWTFVFFVSCIGRQILYCCTAWEAPSSHVLLQINEMDTLPLWNNRASLIFQSCSARDPGPLPQSWQGQIPSKSHLKMAASPRSRRDHPVDWSRGPWSFQGWHALPCTHPTVAGLRFPQGSSLQAQVTQLQCEAEKWKPGFHIDSLSRKLRMWEWVTFCGPKSG